MRPRRRRSTREPFAATLKRIFAAGLAVGAPIAAAVSCRAGGEPAAVPDASRTTPDASTGTAPAAADAACDPVLVDPAFFGEDGSCAQFVRAPCGVPDTLRGAGCDPDPDFCAQVCPQGFFFICSYPSPTCEDGGIAADAAIYVDCTRCLGNIGRRPVGMSEPPRRAHRSSVGAYFARAAFLESASVTAFVQLEARLASICAPRRLRRAALRAARDEERHAKITARLARLYGGTVAVPSVPCVKELTLEELALENAVEGCVRETFGVLVGWHQAARASDAEIARAATALARDEARHAELAWEIHQWLWSRVGARARARVRAAQRRVLADLRDGAGAWPPEVANTAGLPDRASEIRLLDAFEARLFAPSETASRGRQRTKRAASSPRK